MSRKNRRRGRKSKSGFSVDSVDSNVDSAVDAAVDEPVNEKNSMAFAFGEPERALPNQINGSSGSHLTVNGDYYDPPVSLNGLARLLRANAFHGPLLEFKTNMVMRDFKPSEIIKRQTMHAAVTDYMVFLNLYFQIVVNGYGEALEVRHMPAINMRRMKERNRYCYINSDGNAVPFKVGEIVHIKNYDVSQNIYGMPSYLGAIQSMLLNEDATLFRRKYYLNGAHMGYIFYSSSSGLSGDDQESIKKAIKSSKGVGNFRNMFLHLPGGREKDIQILPVGDFSTKDELEKIKNISRDDIIAAHRIPAAMASVLPAGSSNFGDITKVDAVYHRNEIMPIRQQLLDINDWLPVGGQIGFDSAENVELSE